MFRSNRSPFWLRLDYGLQEKQYISGPPCHRYVINIIDYPRSHLDFLIHSIENLSCKVVSALSFPLTGLKESRWR